MDSSLYNVAVKLSIDVNSFNSMAKLAMGVMGQLESAMNKAGLSASNLSLAMKGVGAVMVGTALTAGGVTLARGLDGAVSKAATLQTIMTSVGVALTDQNGNRLDFSHQQAALKALQVQAITVGETNQMSVLDTAKILQAAVGAGITQPGQLQAMLKPLANFSEVLMQAKGLSPDESASTAAKFAHLFGAYTAPDMTRMTDLLGRALFVSPSTPQEFENLISQYAGVVRPLYGTSAAGRPRFTSDAVQTAMIESQLGQTTRGGLAFAQMIARTLGGSSLRGTGQNKALTHLDTLAGGMRFFGKDGTFNGVANALTILARAAAALHNPRETGQLFKDAFGQVGNRQAGILADPITIKRLALAGGMLGKNGLPTMEAIQKQFNSTEQGQLNQAMKNWQTFLVVTGTQLLPYATQFAATLATLTRNAVEFARHNPGMIKAAVLIAGIAAAAAIVIGPLVALAGAIVIVAAAWPIIAGIVGTIAAFATGVGEVVVVLAVVAGLIVLVGLGLRHLLEFLHLIPTGHAAATTTPAALTPGNAAPPGSPHGHWDIIGAGKSGQIRRWMPDPPPPATMPPPRGPHGIGGGGRVINLGGLHFHGWDPEHHKSFIEDAKREMLATLNQAMGHDEYYGGLSGLSGSTSPGVNGY